jgi:hypothetical protein
MLVLWNDKEYAPKSGFIAGIGRVDGGQVLSVEVELVELFVSRCRALCLTAARRPANYRQGTLFCKKDMTFVSIIHLRLRPKTSIAFEIKHSLTVHLDKDA